MGTGEPVISKKATSWGSHRKLNIESSFNLGNYEKTCIVGNSPQKRIVNPTILGNPEKRICCSKYCSDNDPQIVVTTHIGAFVYSGYEVKHSSSMSVFLVKSNGPYLRPSKSSKDPVVVMKFEFSAHSARLLRKLDDVLLWILSTDTGL